MGSYRVGRGGRGIGQGVVPIECRPDHLNCWDMALTIKGTDIYAVVPYERWIIPLKPLVRSRRALGQISRLVVTWLTALRDLTIAKATATTIHSLEQRLHDHTVIPRSTQPSTLRGTVEWVLASKRNNNKIAMVRVPERIQYKIAVLSSSRYRAAIPGTTHSCRWHTWSTSTPLCLHRSPGSTLFQTFHHRRPSFSGCRLTDLELTTRHSRFGTNTAFVPAPIENFFISTILYLLAL